MTDNLENCCVVNNNLSAYDRRCFMESAGAHRFPGGVKKKHSVVVKAVHVTGREEAKLGTFSFFFIFLLEEQMKN